MSAATKVTVAIVVLFAVVLGIYYGFGGPDETAAVPPELLPPAEQDPVANAAPAVATTAVPAAEPIAAEFSEKGGGDLARSIEEALWAQGGAEGDDAAAATADDPWVLRAPTLMPEPEAREPAAAESLTQSRTVEYVVQPDDSMWMIAKRWFGDPNRWREIARGNPDVNPDRLHVGQRLQLPAHNDAGGMGLNRPVAIAATRSPAAAGQGRYHTVLSGDSLSTIADEYYRTETRWREIYEANRGTIGGNPDRLDVGMRLRIP